MERSTELSKLPSQLRTLRPRRAELASLRFTAWGQVETPEEVWMESHVSVKWSISRVTITATSRLEKRSKVPVDVPERASFSRNHPHAYLFRSTRYVHETAVAS